MYALECFHREASVKCLCTGNNTRVYIIIVLLYFSFLAVRKHPSSIFKNICVFQLHFRWQETHTITVTGVNHSIFHLFHKMCNQVTEVYLDPCICILNFSLCLMKHSTGKTGHILDIQIRNNLNEMASLFYKISLIKRKSTHLIQKGGCPKEYKFKESIWLICLLFIQ